MAEHDIDLNVTYVEQTYDFDCWVAAARMVWHYHYGNTDVPLNTGRIAEFYAKGLRIQNENQALRDSMLAAGQSIRDYCNSGLRQAPSGIPNNEFAALQQIGFMPIAIRTKEWSARTLSWRLRAVGPLWFARAAYGHIIVIKGVKDEEAMILDPASKTHAARNITITQLNRETRWTVDSSVMYLKRTSPIGA